MLVITVETRPFHKDAPSVLPIASGIFECNRDLSTVDVLRLPGAPLFSTSSLVLLTVVHLRMNA